MYGGIWDSIQNVLNTFGISAATTTATAQALAAPTLANIQKVKDVFAAEGTSAPPELLDALYGRYYDSIASNPYAQSGNILSSYSTWLPYLIGIGGIFLIVKLSKRR